MVGENDENQPSPHRDFKSNRKEKENICMKKLRKILLLVLVAALLSVSVLAATGVVDAKLTYRDIRITLDGETVEPKDANGKSTEPFIMNDSTYLPVRALAEALGCTVLWDDAANTVRIYKDTVPADTAIRSVKALGFVDVDGPKVKAIAVEYACDLSGMKVDKDTFAIELNDTAVAVNAQSRNFGGGEIGDITRVYVNDKPEVSADGGSGKGNYVILEVYTDYQHASEQTFTTSMCVGVKQLTELTAAGTKIAPSMEMTKNYAMVESYNEWKKQWQTKKEVNDGAYAIEGIEGFRYFYTGAKAEKYPTDGAAFHVDHCFSEQTGLYEDIDLAYALYVPADWHADGRYALVTLENPAANAGTHPMESVLQTRGPSVYSSDWAQDLVKKTHGLDGLIVVVPTVTQRVNDNGGTPAEYEAVVQLWDTLIEKYSVDPNYVYGTGQSVGGMILAETNRNRDNFFAGIWMFENQWAQNYNKDGVFARGMMASNYKETAQNTTRHYYRINDTITWNYHYDNDGNKSYDDHDPYNYYYLISDDNILITNRSANNLSVNTWTELSYLYSDLTGYSIPRCTVDANADLEEQDAQMRAFLKDTENQQGIYWVIFQDGSNGYSPRRLTAGYEWLLTQSRKTEMERAKLDLNKPFELAETQIQDESRLVNAFVAPGTEQPFYYLTGKAGAGTQFYNTSWLNLSKVCDAVGGWLPEGMSWQTGVSAAKITGVTPIVENGKLTAVAIGYDRNMAGAKLFLEGDAVENSRGVAYTDYFVTRSSYALFDGTTELDAKLTNAYISAAPARSGAARGTGSGNYVILELEPIAAPAALGVRQLSSVWTATAIATPGATIYR